MEKQNRKEGKMSQLPVAAAEFIKLVINKMRYRKKVQDDVKAELAAHFEDELKGCKADTDRGQRAKQLVGGFGDVKMLAVMLRRAKKRCRPLWRTVVARAFQTVGVLLVCLVLYIVWFLTGKPVITRDYIAEFNLMVRPVADESLNAATLYNKAIEVFEEDLPDDISEALGKRYYEATKEDKQLMGKWLTDNDEMFELVIAGARKPYYWQHYEGEEMLSVLLPHLSKYRRLAFSLRWRSRLHAENGRYEEAFRDIKTCYRFGRHVKGTKLVLIEQLVGVTIEAIAVENLRSILSEHEIDAAVLATLQKDFEQMLVGEDFTMSFEGEKMFVYDEIQRCFTEDRFGGGHLYLSRIGDITDDPGGAQEIILETLSSPEGWARAVKILFFHPNKQQTREAADRFYAYCDAFAQKTPAQIRTEGIDGEKEIMKIVGNNVFLSILTPALGRACRMGHRNKTDVEATLTIVALLWYKADKGSYPENLRQLITAGYLTELPIDLYSGKPLVYRKTDESFILYSVGENIEDDGGKSDTSRKGKPRLWDDHGDSDAVFWPVPKSELNQ
ncbi:MAG: hypothetical protein ACYSSN_04610 [Planctomycetota bacterium]|jgi:hypothetical protein